MGTAIQRQLYFEKEIRNQPSADLYLKALAESPYKTHRRMAVALGDMLGQFKLDAKEEEAEIEKEIESQKFAEKLGVV